MEITIYDDGQYKCLCPFGRLRAFGYLLLERPIRQRSGHPLRAWGLAGSALERATLGTVRLRLLKVSRASHRERAASLCAVLLGFPAASALCAPIRLRSGHPLPALRQAQRLRQRLAAVESS